MLNLNFQGNDWFVPRLRDFGESLKHILSCSASAVRYRCHFHLQMEKHLSKYIEDKSTETSYATKIMDCYKKLKMYKYIFTSLFNTVDGKTTNWNSISDDFIPLCLHHAALVSLFGAEAEASEQTEWPSCASPGTLPLCRTEVFYLSLNRKHCTLIYWHSHPRPALICRSLQFHGCEAIAPRHYFSSFNLFWLLLMHYYELF